MSDWVKVDPKTKMAKQIKSTFWWSFTTPSASNRIVIFFGLQYMDGQYQMLFLHRVVCRLVVFIQIHLFFLDFRQSSCHSSIPDCDPEIYINQAYNKIHKCILTNICVKLVRTLYSHRYVIVQWVWLLNTLKEWVKQGENCFWKLFGLNFVSVQPAWRERSSTLGSRVGLRRTKYEVLNCH